MKKKSESSILMSLSTFLGNHPKFKENYTKINLEYQENGWVIKAERKPLIDIIKPWEGK